MLSILLALHFLVTILLIVLILVQKHDGGGLAGGLSSAANSFMTSRGQAYILTKATAILMTIFFVNCLVMAKLAKGSPRPQSFVDAAANELNIPQKGNFDQTDHSTLKNMTNNVGKNADTNSSNLPNTTPMKNAEV